MVYNLQKLFTSPITSNIKNNDKTQKNKTSQDHFASVINLLTCLLTNPILLNLLKLVKQADVSSWDKLGCTLKFFFSKDFSVSES